MDIERFDPETGDPTLALEHYHRYYLASHLVAQKEVLDIACGEGYGSAYLSLSARSVLGIDMHQQAIEQARQKYRSFSRVRFEVGLCEELMELQDQFDVIVSFETIEHLDEHAQRRFLHGVTQRLRPNGIFLLSTPNQEVYRRASTRANPFHRHELSLETMEQLLKPFFRHVVYAFQSTIVASHVECALPVSQESIPCFVRDNLFDVPVSTGQPDDAPFILAYCSNEPIPENVQVRFRSFYWDTAHVQPFQRFLAWGQQLERELNEARHQYQLLKTEFEERTKWALTLNNEIAEKNAYIHRLQQEFDQRTSWALKLDKEIQERDHFIDKLRKEFDDRTSWALQLNTQLEETQRQLGILAQQKRELEMINDYLLQQLQRVRSSRWYRLLSALGLLPVITSSETTTL